MSDVSRRCISWTSAVDRLRSWSSRAFSDPLETPLNGDLGVAFQVVPLEQAVGDADAAAVGYHGAELLRQHRFPHVAGHAVAIDVVGLFRHHRLHEGLQHHRLEIHIGFGRGFRPARLLPSGERRIPEIADRKRLGHAAPRRRCGSPAWRAPPPASPARRHALRRARCRSVGRSPRKPLRQDFDWPQYARESLPQPDLGTG